MSKDNNILNKAKVIYDRSEKETQYGPLIECMEKTAVIATMMGKNNITAEDAYNVMIAVKIARESYTHKEDNLLDAVAYMSSLNDYRNGEK